MLDIGTQATKTESTRPFSRRFAACPEITRAKMDLGGGDTWIKRLKYAEGKSVKFSLAKSKKNSAGPSPGTSPFFALYADNLSFLRQ